MDHLSSFNGTPVTHCIDRHLDLIQAWVLGACHSTGNIELQVGVLVPWLIKQISGWKCTLRPFSVITSQMSQPQCAMKIVPAVQHGKKCRAKTSNHLDEPAALRLNPVLCSRLLVQRFLQLSFRTTVSGKPGTSYKVRSDYMVPVVVAAKSGPQPVLSGAVIQRQKQPPSHCSFRLSSSRSTSTIGFPGLHSRL